VVVSVFYIGIVQVNCVLLFVSLMFSYLSQELWKYYGGTTGLFLALFNDTFSSS
jgi:hypothetical protein